MVHALGEWIKTLARQDCQSESRGYPNPIHWLILTRQTSMRKQALSIEWHLITQHKIRSTRKLVRQRSDRHDAVIRAGLARRLPLPNGSLNAGQFHSTVPCQPPCVVQHNGQCSNWPKEAG